MWKEKIAAYFERDTVPAIVPYGVIEENYF
jgi:hypothetical protein